MVRVFVAGVLMALQATQVVAQVEQVSIFPELTGNALIERLREEYRPGRVASYNDARDSMYMSIYYENGGVECFYTGFKIDVDAHNARIQAQDRGFDTEHLWPQSKFSGRGNAYSDLHHLRPNRAVVNQSRSNFRFRSLAADEVTFFWKDAERRSTVPDGDLGLWSKTKQGSNFDNSFFEPRDAVKGDVARAMFYFYTMYEDDVLLADRDYFESQRAWLREFHEADAADSTEIARTWAIAAMQDGKPNPFLLDSTLVRRAFFTNYEGPVLPPIEAGTFEAAYSFSGTASCVDEDDEPTRQQLGITLGKMVRVGVICNTVSNAFNSNGWPGLFSASHYVGFAAVADRGYTIGFAQEDSLRLFLRRSGTGPDSYRVVLVHGGEEMMLHQAILASTSQNVEVKIPMPNLDGADGFELRIHAWGAGASAGTFRIASLEMTGKVDVAGIGTSIEGEEANGLPREVVLYPAYPNPFNPSATITYEISNPARVVLSVHDILGRSVAMLVDGYNSAGRFQVVFDASGLASGIYFARLRAVPGRMVVSKMVLVK